MVLQALLEDPNVQDLMHDRNLVRRSSSLFPGMQCGRAATTGLSGLAESCYHALPNLAHCLHSLRQRNH